MIVIDANILIDALFEKNEQRRKLALDFFSLIKGKRVIVPRIFVVEVVSVAKRLGIKLDKKVLLNLISKFHLVGEESIFNIDLYIAERVHPRAVDSYYIATAILTDSIIVSNDRILVENCKKAGIKAYYLIEEFDKLKNEI